MRATKIGALTGVSGLLLLLLALFATHKNPGPIGPQARLRALSHDFEFAEGLTCDRQGNVFFSDQPNDRIMQWTLDGQLRTFLQPAGRANGMQFDASGQLIVCADANNELWSISPDGKVKVVLGQFEGKKLNGPNDLWIRPDQAVYFTDPYYQRPWWTHHSQPQPGQHVYFLSADRKTLRQVTTDLKKPNGIVGTPDGRTLYVGDSGLSQTFRFDIQPDGQLINKSLFCDQGSDGMTLDVQGNLYLCGQGVNVYNTQGKQIAHIDVPENWVGNICFGGSDKRTLFLAASKGLYSLEMEVAGANQAK